MEKGLSCEAVVHILVKLDGKDERNTHDMNVMRT